METSKRHKSLEELLQAIPYPKDGYIALRRDKTRWEATYSDISTPKHRQFRFVRATTPHAALEKLLEALDVDAGK